MVYLTNTDFVTVGIAIAGNLTLGFVLFFNNRKSATTTLFLLEAVTLSLWSTANYLTYRVTDLNAALWVERFVMFFAVPTSIVFLLLMDAIPGERLRMGKVALWSLVALCGTGMATALSPFLFTSVKVVPGIVTPQPVVGWGMALFVPAAILTIPVGLYLLIRKYVLARGEERIQLEYVMTGVVMMFGFILAFNFILPTVFQDSEFIPLSALFTFPFFAFGAYAVIKHHLLNAKVVATEAVSFLLAIVTLFEVMTSGNILDFIIRVAIFCLVLIFVILLIESVIREIKQREELERLNKKIEADKEELEELSRFKSQLLSLASHQIRSPLAAIKGFVALIQSGAYGEVNDKVKETLGKVQKSADDLIGLINTLLDVRKVEEGKMEYAFTKEDLVPLVKGIVDGIQPLAMAKKLTLTAELPATPVMASIDHEKFKQVVQNLIDNAIKYTPSGFVKASLAVAGGKISISVSDSGLGIPADLVPHLFEEFIRDERVKKEIRGTGLGLYIARSITEAHGGTLTATSPGEGKGSMFTATIPLAS